MTPISDDLRRWLADQPDAEALAEVWTTAGLAVAPAPAVDVPAARARLDARLDGLAAPRFDAAPAMRRAPDRAPSRLRRRVAVFALTVAAVLALVAGVGAWRGQTVTARAASGVLAVALPDGSAVTLSAGSRMTYRRAFGAWPASRRDVTLSGEAFFAVAKDAERPFSVDTDGARVTVLGTRFNVRAWATGETSVVVEGGRVRVASPAGRSVDLTPGRRAVVSAEGRIAETAADVPAALAWRRAAFAVYDAPLGAVAVQVERAYGTPVRLYPGVDAQERVTALLPRADRADAVVADLAAGLGYRVRARAGGFDLFP